MVVDTEIKLEKFKEAVDDCSEVLKLEELNSKGLFVVSILYSIPVLV